MTKLRLVRIDPLGASLTGGLLTVVMAAASFTVVGLEYYLQGQGSDLLRSVPLKTLYYGLLVSTSVFVFALGFNIAGHYTGGIELTLRDPKAKPETGPVVIGPPSATR